MQKSMDLRGQGGIDAFGCGEFFFVGGFDAGKAAEAIQQRATTLGADAGNLIEDRAHVGFAA